MKLSDSYEGAISFYEKFTTFKVPQGGKSNCYNKQREKQLRKVEEIEELMNYRKNIFVNCWSINESESYALWKIYTKRNSGIAIKSTYGRLMQAINYNKNIEIKPVEYKNFKNLKLNKEQVVTRKTTFYAFEKELRLFSESQNKKVEIDVDNDVLIDKIYFSPFMASCDKYKIENTITEINNKLKDRFMHSEIKLNNKTR